MKPLIGFGQARQRKLSVLGGVLEPVLQLAQMFAGGFEMCQLTHVHSGEVEVRIQDLLLKV